MSFKGPSSLITSPPKSQNLGRILTRWILPPPPYKSLVYCAIRDLPALPVPRYPWYLRAGEAMVKGWGGTHRSSGQSGWRQGTRRLC